MNVLKTTYKSSFIASIVAVFLCIIFLIIEALLVTYTRINETMIPVLACFSLYFSSFTGGFISAFKKNSGGLVRGLICGLCICIFLCLAALLMPGFKISFVFLGKLLLTALVSTAGGVLSVNISYKKHR